MKLLLNVLTGLVFGIVIVAGVLVFEGDIKFFWAGSMVSVLIWMASLFASKKSDDKIDLILSKIEKIEEKIGIDSKVSEVNIKKKPDHVS